MRDDSGHSVPQRGRGRGERSELQLKVPEDDAGGQGGAS